MTTSLTTGPQARDAGALLTIDLGALCDNWRLLRGRIGGAECAAVIKADAYGIGLEPAMAALRDAGCRTFFVAHLSEAVRARTVDAAAAIYVLNGFLPDTGPVYARFNLRPILGSLPEIDEWAAFAEREPSAPPPALHVDTGMNRLGLSLEEARALSARGLPNALRPGLLMSHFAGAEDPADPITTRQVRRFEEVTRLFPGIPASLLNSSGHFLESAPAHALSRPGYALYGGNPVPGRPNPMKPVVRLEAKVLQLRTAEAGEGVGYNGRRTADGRRRLAVLSIGYADGYPRPASATDAKIAADLPAGEAIVAGRRCPFMGTVSMDLIIIDVTHVPEDEVRRGDTAILIGDGLDVDEVGQRAGTIGYEILTGLGRRHSRRYVNG